jgi:beta-xylosidase
MNNIKSITLTAALFLSAFLAQAQKPTQSKTKGDAYFVNPIFAGDYPDPIIMREGDDFHPLNIIRAYWSGIQKIWSTGLRLQS